eukprot:GEMP01039600.1.p1 GENE.GEMP01039600.1~~GEMP01039600.1.p1  ORF type:complete len:393 (+),score=71.62 GEMP01039600.1:111-1289(+)
MANCFVTKTNGTTIDDSVLAMSSHVVCLAKHGMSASSCTPNEFKCFEGDEGESTKYQIAHDLHAASMRTLGECMDWCCNSSGCVGLDYVEKDAMPWFIWVGGLCGFVFFLSCCAACRYKTTKHRIILGLVALCMPLTAILFWAWLYPKAKKRGFEKEVKNAGGIGDLCGMVVGYALFCVVIPLLYPSRFLDPGPEPGLVPYARLQADASSGGAGPGEVAKNLLDENRSTNTPPWFTNKWNQHGKSGWIEISVTDNGPPIVLDGYALRSANDFPGRDPKEWQLFGIDVTTGEKCVLHTQSAGSHWDARWQWQQFWCTAAKSENIGQGAPHPGFFMGGQICGKADPCLGGDSDAGQEQPCGFWKFRIEISSNRGDGCTQLAQVKLYEKTYGTDV